MINSDYQVLVRCLEALTPAQRERIVLAALRAVMAGEQDWQPAAGIYNIICGLS